MVSGMRSAHEMPPPRPLFHICAACHQQFDVAEAEPFTALPCPHCGELLRVRTTFDHFQLLNEIGAGGMSRVFEAEDFSLGRRVALKILNRDCSRDAARLAQFEREARLTASLSHPHVVKVFSVGRDQTHFYIAMELVPGGSLEERIERRGAQPEEEVLALAVQTAQGLRAAQQAGLIHRDLKPGNILFAEDGSAKLVDFGLALVQGRDVDASDELWATPFYVPPEKLDELPDTFRGDMYSLGATLFHALAGKPPHAKDTNSVAELKRLKSLPVHLRPVAPHLSNETCAIIDRLLSRKPEHRYGSYDELVQHLENARRHVKSRREAARRKRQEAPWALWTGVGAAAAAAAILAYVVIESGDDPPAPTPPPEPPALKSAPTTGQAPTEKFVQAREWLAAGDIARARPVFVELGASAATKQPTLNWALFHAGLAALLEDDAAAARRHFARLRELTADSPSEGVVRRFFSDTATLLAAEGPVTADGPEDFDVPGLRRLALLPLGLRAWADGRFARARELLRRFAHGEPPENYEWAGAYRALTEPYLHDLALEEALPSPPTRGEDLTADAGHAALQSLASVSAALKIPSGPLRRALAAREETFRRLLASRQEAEERQAGDLAREQAQSDQTALEAALEKIAPLRAAGKYALGVETLRELDVQSPFVKEKLEAHLFLWEAADEFLTLLAADIKQHGFTGTLERTPPLPAVAGATIVRASRDKWLVRAGRVETTLDLTATTPAFLISLASAFAEKTADSDAYYRRRETLVAYAEMNGLSDFARLAGERLARESGTFRAHWKRLAGEGR